MDNLFRRIFKKQVLVTQRVKQINAGEETLLLTLEIRKITKSRSLVNAFPAVEVYSGSSRCDHGVDYRLDWVNEFHCEVYICISSRWEGERKVKLRLNRQYKLSKKSIVIHVLDPEGTTTSTNESLCSTRARKTSKHNEEVVPSYGRGTSDESESAPLLGKHAGRTDVTCTGGFTNSNINIDPAETSRASLHSSAQHTWIQIISPVDHSVKAGEILSFRINLPEVMRQKIMKDGRYDLSVKLDNDRINPASTDYSGSTFHVRSLCAGEKCLSFSIRGELRRWKVNVLSSTPYSLRNVTYTPESSLVDATSTLDNQTLYHNIWTIFEAEILDKFGNIVSNVNIVRLSSANSGIQFDGYKIRNGKLTIRMRSCLAHVQCTDITVHFKCSDDSVETVLKKAVQVSHPPCSSRLSQVTSQDQICIAGRAHQIHITIKDVFNNPVPKGAGINCIVYAWSLEPHFKTGEYHICDSDVIHITENERSGGYLQLVMVIKPKRAGSRRILAYLNGEQVDTSDVHFDVHPNLDSLRCKSIRRLHSEGKSAILEVSIEDCSGNSASLGEGDLRLVQESGPPNNLTCQRTKVRSSVVLIEHELWENERYFLSLEKRSPEGHYTSFHKFEVDTHSDVLQSNDPEGKKFLLYNDNICQVVRVRGTWSGIECRDTTAAMIEGPDNANIKNIKRALNFPNDVELNESKSGGETTRTEIRFRKKVSQEFLEACREVVLHLLRGIYYRKKASESRNNRSMWKERIERLMRIQFSKVLGPYKVPKSAQAIQLTLKQYRSERDKHGDLMKSYNRQASEEFFAFFNYKQEVNKVDLHGLLVADEQRYAALRRTLMDKKIDDLVIEEIIRHCGWEGDEAIRKLEEKLDTFDFDTAKKNGQRWIEIVVGAGHHSREGQKIRPKVERFLQERSMDFAPVNKGSLVVTLEKYNGPEPCFAEYYCKECDRCWKNNRSWSDTPQTCQICKKTKNKKIDCWPLKQRAVEFKPTTSRSKNSGRIRTVRKHKVPRSNNGQRIHRRNHGQQISVSSQESCVIS